MKQLKTLFYKLAVFAAVLSYSNVWSQIDYAEDFEGTINWYDPDGWYYLDIPYEPCDNFTYITFLYSDYADYEVVTVSPSIGISSGGQATLTYNYKLVLYSVPGVPLENDPSWGSVKVEYSTSQAGPWTVIDAITPENHLPSTSCATRTAQFTPEAGSEVFIRLNAAVNGEATGIDALVYFDNLVVVQTELCETPAPNALDTEQSACSNANIGDLNTGDYNSILWYATETGGVPLSSNTILAGDATYYAANVEECESVERVAVNVTIITVENPEAEVVQEFCASATVADLQVEDGDAEVLWYEAATGGIPLAATTTLVDGSVYHASQITDGCESAERTEVAVIVTVAEEPVVSSPQTFTGSTTLSAIEVGAEGIITWYATEADALAGENSIEGSTEVSSSGTYYVTQTISGCESEPATVSVEITLGVSGFDKGTLRLYPNPVDDILIISADESIESIAVYDLLGQKLESMKGQVNEAILNLAQLSAGTYIVEITRGEHLSTFKIVKR